MEKTIEKKETKKPKKPKKVETFDDVIEFNKKHFFKAGENSITDVDFNKGTLIFKDINKKEHTIDTNKELLVYTPSIFTRFSFAKPVIMLHAYQEATTVSEQVWDDEEDEYIETGEEVTNKYNVYKIYIFYSLSSNSISTCPIKTMNRKVRKLDVLFNSKVVSANSYSAISGSNIGTFLDALTNETFTSYDNDEISFSNERKILFYEGNKYKDDEIKKITSNKYLFTGEVLRTASHSSNFIYKSYNDMTIYKDLKIFKTAPFMSNSKLQPRPILCADEKSDTVTFKDWIFNDYTNATKGIDYNNSQLVKYDLIISFDTRYVTYKNVENFPIVKQHYDCCGAHLPYKHKYEDNNKKEKYSNLLINKLLLRYMLHTKADFTVFLTDRQVIPGLYLYESVFGKKAVKFLHSYPNMNSGNIINVYHINTTYKVQQKLKIHLNKDKTEWHFRNQISNYLTNNVYTRSEVELELIQWFENSEEKAKKVVKTPNKVTDATRRAYNVTSFMDTPYRNYNYR
jgi:hypothetical protein